MKPEEFKSFEDEEPIAGKWIIVTNNINAKNRIGEMIHVWLTNHCIKSINSNHGMIIFSNGLQILNLSHWKYT